MRRLMARSPWLGLLAALVGFVALGQGLKLGLLPLLPKAAWISQALLKLSLIVVVLVVAKLEGWPAAALGFRGNLKGAGRYSLLALLLGVVATNASILTGNLGMAKIVGQMSLPSVIFWVWIVSSTSEEIFCRGWFQAHLEKHAPSPIDPAGVLLPSAVLFGAMHLTLLLAGAGVGTTLLIVAFATVLGYITALVRGRSGSLYPAIAVHVAFNVGGVIGGALYVILYRLTTGQLPPFAQQ
ncbi:MAG: CPBP family intramembrane metalloprotease [Bryobacterales bacterium]|nr:CPBP family intramembrane metalloprotease [Bryobacterales bacterium]